jgi:hypothetical protein
MGQAKRGASSSGSSPLAQSPMSGIYTLIQSLIIIIFPFLSNTGEVYNVAPREAP